MNMKDIFLRGVSIKTEVDSQCDCMYTVYDIHTYILNMWESYVYVQTILDSTDMLMSIGTFMWRHRHTARQTIGVTWFNQIYLHVNNVTYAVYLGR